MQPRGGTTSFGTQYTTQRSDSENSCSDISRHTGEHNLAEFSEACNQTFWNVVCVTCYILCHGWALSNQIGVKFYINSDQSDRVHFPIVIFTCSHPHSTQYSRIHQDSHWVWGSEWWEDTEVTPCSRSQRTGVGLQICSGHSWMLGTMGGGGGVDDKGWELSEDGCVMGEGSKGLWQCSRWQDVGGRMKSYCGGCGCGTCCLHSVPGMASCSPLSCGAALK